MWSLGALKPVLAVHDRSGVGTGISRAALTRIRQPSGRAVLDLAVSVQASVQGDADGDQGDLHQQRERAGPFRGHNDATTKGDQGSASS